MGLVEQPEGGAAGQQSGQGDAAALAGREAAGRRVAQAPDQAETLERGVGLGGGQAQGLDGEVDVLRRTQFVVDRGGMPQEPDVAADGGVLGDQIDPEDGGLARGDRQKACTGPQEAGLAGAVGADHHDHLAGLEREVHPGEGGEAAGESDGGAELDDRGHGLPHHGRGGGSRGSKWGLGVGWARGGPPPGGRWKAGPPRALAGDPEATLRTHGQEGRSTGAASFAR